MSLFLWLVSQMLPLNHCPFNFHCAIRSISVCPPNRCHASNSTSSSTNTNTYSGNSSSICTMSAKRARNETQDIQSVDTYETLLPSSSPIHGLRDLAPRLTCVPPVSCSPPNIISSPSHYPMDVPRDAKMMASPVDSPSRANPEWIRSSYPITPTNPTAPTSLNIKAELLHLMNQQLQRTHQIKNDEITSLEQRFRTIILQESQTYYKLKQTHFNKICCWFNEIIHSLPTRGI